MSLPQPIREQLLLVVGFVGHMGAGKSTATRYLMRRRGFAEIGFSTAMKQTMQILHIPRTRANMQRYGTDLFRKHWNDNIWVQNLEHRATQHILQAKDRHPVFGTLLGIAIPDVRFDNEALWLKQVGGYLIGIDSDPKALYARAMERPDRDPPKSFKEFGLQLEHISERAIQFLIEKRCDYLIHDNGISVDVLQKNVELIFQKVLELESKKKFMRERNEAIEQAEIWWNEHKKDLDLT